MLISDIKRVIDQVSREKGIDRITLIRALEEALKSAVKKKFGEKVDAEIQYNEEIGEIEVFQFKEVVEKITDPNTQIDFEEGQKLDPECEIGDSLGTKMDTTTFGRIAAQSAKQVIIQKMKDAEKDAVYADFIGRKGEIINGIVQRFERGSIIVNLGNAESILPNRDQIPGETYKRGDRIRACIIDVLHETRGPQIILSRTHPNFLINLFKTEVPEINEGIVDIMGVVREPGVRAKIAVSSHDPDIDPVGACVGMKGSRVQNVVQELKGEKIDIITWYADIAKYVCNALAPAEIIRVIIDEQNHSMEVIVPDESLSIAIGKGGQNVRLASKLTSWRLDVQNDTKYSKTLKDGYESLIKLPGIGISLADALYENGFFSPLELSSASVQELLQIREMTEAKAAELIEAANESLKNLGTDETSDKDETSDTDGTDETSDKDETSGTDGTDETSDKDKTSGTDGTDETSDKDETSGTNGTDDTSDKDETSDTDGTDDTSDKDETSGTDGTDDTSDKDETSGTDDTSDKDDQDIESNPLMKDTE